jgi:hypothetical protein
MGLWRVDGGVPVRLTSSGFPLESRLEALLEKDPAMLGEPLLVVGRQVRTKHGGVIDLLAVDAEGTLHVLELKRERTPREVVAQALDYGSWVAALSHEDVLAIFSARAPDAVFEQVFADTFGASPPEELNAAQRLTIIAGEMDAATERIVAYLNGSFAVPINVVFFRYFADAGREYLARTWLVDEDAAPAGPQRAARGVREAWNGRDWYVSFGEEPGGRSWEDARRYGFVSAGGGLWFSKTIRGLPEGARVFVCIPKAGYVGVGTVSGGPRRFDSALLSVDGVEHKLADLELKGGYSHPPDNEDTAEYVVPVVWEAAKDRSEAVWRKGMFANQNSACKLRNKFTLDVLTSAFGLTSDVESGANPDPT